MEVFVEGYGCYTLWDDCAFCFVQGKSGSCTHKPIDSVPLGEQRDEMQGYHNGPEMQGYHNGPVNFSPRHSQIKSVHDSFNSGVFPDSDSGFSSSLKTRMYPEDFSPRGGSPDPGPAAGPLVRARSMSRLNSTFSSQDLTPHDHPYVFNRSVRNLKQL
ncbi:unnamed protein product [Mytilus coruscus]|uniref:Uncharacterized protein n=1 Tax=Mytilus coruscus TaxID=42192 RepID=A0A6J8APU0_MYTCO|nr:unnamed protein product [Mytilus coruscus]